MAPIQSSVVPVHRAPALQPANPPDHPSGGFADARTAGSVMSAPVVCISAEEAVGRARCVLASSGFHHLVVVSDDVCLGVVDAAMVTAVARVDRNAPVRAALTGWTQTASLGTPLGVVKRLLAATPAGAVVVADEGGHAVGIITTADVPAPTSARADLG